MVEGEGASAPAWDPSEAFPTPLHILYKSRLVAGKNS